MRAVVDGIRCDVGSMPRRGGKFPERTGEAWRHCARSAAGVEVTGYPVAKNFAEIGCFV
jgi:hypothetical protein